MFIRRLLLINIFFTLLLTAANITTQAQAVSSDLLKYNFIRLDENEIYESSPNSLKHFFRSMDALIQRGDRQVRILHIGDSHIQAGFFPEKMREQLQSHKYFGNAGRGFIFPYRMAETNNPADYKVYFTGKWEYSKNIQRNGKYSCGISGITVNTSDTLAYVQILQNYNGTSTKYRVNRLKIFHKRSPESLEVCLVKGNPADRINHEYYTEFVLPEELDTIELVFEKTQPQQQFFELYGFSLETDYPGLVYSSVGVNGADLNAYLRCELLGPQLNILDPDLVIISLGANDAYLKGFNTEEFKKNYIRFISDIRNELPNASILLTTAGDGYRYRKYFNYNYVKARDIVMEVAKEKDVAVWDFFAVMGGSNSIYKWYKAGLAQSDKLHLTQSGYMVQGQLLHDALVRAYYDYLDIYLEKK